MKLRKATRNFETASCFAHLMIVNFELFSSVIVFEAYYYYKAKLK